MTPPGRNLYHSIFWRLLLDVASRGVFFAVNVLIARTLSVSDFGYFAVAVSLSQVFYIFTDIGTHLQLVKELGGRRTQSPYHWVGFFQLKILLFVLSFLAFLIFVPFSWKWDRYWLPVIAFVWMSSNSLLDFEQFVCNGLARMDLARQLMLVHRGFLLLGVGVPLVFFRSLPAVSIGLLFGALLGTIFSNIIFFRDVQPQKFWIWNWPEWRRIVRLSLPLGIGGAFGSWYLRLGMIVLGYVATASVAGEYAAAFRLFEITYIIPAAVMSIGVPHLAEAYEQGRKVFFDELKKISRLMVLGGLLWGGTLFFFGGWIVVPLFGPNFGQSVPYLKVFSFVGLMVFLNYVATHIMVIIEKQMRHAVHQVLAFLTCLALSVALASNYEAMGMALALLGAETLLFFLTIFYLGRFFSGKNKDVGFARIPSHDN